MRKYVERLSVPLPRRMKAELLQLVKEDGRRLGEFVRSLIGDAIREKKTHTTGSTTGSTTGGVRPASPLPPL